MKMGAGRLAAGAVVAGGATAASHTLLGMDWITATGGILTIAVGLLWVLPRCPDHR